MIISTNHVHKSYKNVHAIHDLNMRVPEGSAYALVGTNGAGKTTTLRALVNIINPDKGEIKILGVNSRQLSHHDFLKIGYVSENQILPERLSVRDFFNYLRGLYKNWDISLEQELVRNLDLPLDRKLGKLSHGMRMKTVLIASLAFRPKLLILDEPLSGMDALTRDEVIEGILSQADETTILISSHELAEIENFTTDIAFMDSGQLIFQESTETLKNRFKRVNVTLAAIKSIPESVPESWALPKTEGHFLQFIESDFQGHEVLYRKLTEHFGAVQFEYETMSLREITKTLIRQSRISREGLAHE